MPFGKARFSQSLPESLAALHVPLGAGPGKGSEDVQAPGADGACGLLSRASPTGDRLRLMKEEEPFSAHLPLLTSELGETTSQATETAPVSPAVLA